MKKISFLLLFMPLMAFADVTAISLSPALTETVFQLGAGRSLVGRSSVCNFPAEVKILPVCGGFADPEMEKIIRMRPGFLLVNDLINPKLAVTLERNGVKPLFLPCRNIEDYRKCVAKLGEALNCSADAEKELDRCDRELKKLRGKPRLGVKVLWVIWDSPLMVAGAGSFPESLIELAGGENIAGNVKQEYFKCSFDWVLRLQPDIIVWSAQGMPDKKHRFWGRLEAVRRNRVVGDIEPDLIQRPGPRIFQGAKELRRRFEILKKEL